MFSFGLAVIVNSYLCEVKFVRWARKHRKARINKKWQKRYGAIYSCCPGKAFQMLDKIIVCPCFKNQIDKLPELERKVAKQA